MYNTTKSGCANTDLFHLTRLTVSFTFLLMLLLMTNKPIVAAFFLVYLEDPTHAKVAAVPRLERDLQCRPLLSQREVCALDSRLVPSAQPAPRKYCWHYSQTGLRRIPGCPVLAIDCN